MKKAIHSVIDVITNSSTEIFVEANESTIRTVKSLVDTLLRIGGSDKKVDDLFEFNLICPDREDFVANYRDDMIRDIHERDYGEYDGEKWEKLDEEYQKKYEAEQPDWWNPSDEDIKERYECGMNILLEVKAKTEDIETKGAAKILSELHDLFETTEAMC